MLTYTFENSMAPLPTESPSILYFDNSGRPTTLCNIHALSMCVWRIPTREREALCFESIAKHARVRERMDKSFFVEGWKRTRTQSHKKQDGHRCSFFLVVVRRNKNLNLVQKPDKFQCFFNAIFRKKCSESAVARK